MVSLELIPHCVVKVDALPPRGVFGDLIITLSFSIHFAMTSSYL
jgi:hypothetical protein